MEQYNEIFEELETFDFKLNDYPTFLEVLSKRDAEVLWSRILAFYLNPNNLHGLKDLVLNSLLEVCDFELPKYKKATVEIKVEYKSIDLVIITDTFIIGIENKVNFWLHNDLDDYYEKLKNLGKSKKINEDKIKLIILSKNKCESKFEIDFKNVLYSVFIEKIKENFFKYSNNGNLKYITFLLDFINNIENSLNMPEIINDEKKLSFFQLNYEKIERLIELQNKYYNELSQIISEVTNKINLSLADIIISNEELQKIEEFITYFEKSDAKYYIYADVTNKNGNKRTFQFDFSYKFENNRYWKAYFKDNDIVIEPSFDFPVELSKSLAVDKVSEYIIQILKNKEIINKYIP